jgi:alanine racemase
VKVDTGMTRLGIRPEDAPAVLSRLDALRVTVEGCYTHLACADDADPAFTDEQLRKFQPVVDEARRRFPNVIIHAANSAAVLVHPRSHFDMVRVGLAMYGLYPGPHMQTRAGLKPVMQCKSRVVRTMRVGPGSAVSYGATYRVSRPTVIATVACGYADGYPRLAGNRGQVVIRGRRFPVAGRVSMDYLMVDARDEPVAIGDEVILFGQDVGADEVAGWAQTISYEVLCRVGPRVPRIYLKNGGPLPAGVPEA